MWEKELQTLQSGERAVLGFSGGVDSVVLSQWLLQRFGIRPYLLHVNYGLREEADEDERWCRWYAEEYRFELRVLHADPTKRKGKNLQNWARDLRYQWFEEQAMEFEAHYIFTAHHMDDRRETFLMNALRGTGLTGLTGMSNDRVLRPLASWDKERILAFAQEHQLPWREDASNNTLKYARNKIRHQLAPVLDVVEPRWKGGLKKTVDNLVRDRELLMGFMKEWRAQWMREENGEWLISKGPWMEAVYATTLLYRACQDIDYGLSFEEVHHVLAGEIGQMTQGKTHLLVQDRSAFYLAPIREEDPRTYTIGSMDELGVLPFKLSFEPVERAGMIFDAHHEYLGMAALQFPLEVRVWQPGDTFVPFGMKGKKKVADFLNDLRVPRHHKSHVYVMLSEGEIIWVLGYRIAAHAKVGDGDSMAYLAVIN